MLKTVRFKSNYIPMTPAERQAKRRAIKKGTYYNCQEVKGDGPSSTLLSEGPNGPALPAPVKRTPALPAPPAPPVTAIQKTSSTAGTLALPDAADVSSGESIRLSLPPAVAARLKSLLDRHHAGKNLTAAERAEAEGLIDIAEFFVVQRLRHRLAA